MASTIKDFGALKTLQRELKAQEAAKKIAEAERLLRESQNKLDAQLFQKSVGNVVPLSPPNKASIPSPRPLPIAKHYLADEQAALQESLSDEFTIETLLDTDGDLSFTRPGIGRDVLRKLRSGRWVMQSELDLHGMRRDDAREALGEFVRKAIRQGHRCVRIIHGKGLGSVNKEPVLKSKVRNWLVQKEEILAFCQARAADGGAGALVVLLKSARA